MASRIILLPRKLKDTFDKPPDKEAPGHVFLISAQAWINERPYSLCSFMPVATAKIFGSKIISRGSKPTFSVKIVYARLQISIFRLRVSACPFSSNAITTTAAPYLFTKAACSTNFLSPSFIEIELTTAFP